jgi:hypothetical protein
MRLTIEPTYRLELSKQEMNLLMTFVACASEDTIVAVMQDSSIPDQGPAVMNLLERLESEWMSS